MKYATLCSGIGSPETAWTPLGWECVFHSEIEPFPSAVLKHHQPNVPNYGDMTKYKEWPDNAVDLICAGCPCQSFSVAGLRKGLDDPRGNLTLTYLAILDKYRPRWMVYENVPGLLSDKTGAFGAFLGGLAELGYGFAYRILDAQFVRVESHPGAVPQRRRRLFVVGYLGDWRPAAAVLFEQESLCGHPAPSRTAGQRTAASLVRGSKSSGGIGYDNQALFSQKGDNLIRSTDIPEVSPTVQQGPPFSRTGNDRVECEAIIPCWPASVAPTLDAQYGDKMGQNNQHALNGGGAVCSMRMTAFGEYVDDGTASGMKARDYKDATDLVVCGK